MTRKLELQRVATDRVSPTRGVNLLSRVMTRLEARLRKSLSGRWHEIHTGIEDWNERRVCISNLSEPQNAPSIHMVARSMAYSALEKILPREGQILVQNGDGYLDISCCADDLYFHGDSLVTPCLLRTRAYRRTSPGELGEVVSIVAQNAAIYAEAAAGSQFLPMFDIRSWSVRTRLVLPSWLDREDIEYLQERWTLLRPFAGSSVLYRSNRSYDGQYQTRQPRSNTAWRTSLIVWSTGGFQVSVLLWANMS